MPGLFDNIGTNGGLLGLLMGNGAGPGGLAGAGSPFMRENAFRGKAYQQLQEQGDPNASLLMANPQAYGMARQQQIMNQTYQQLLPKVGPQNAALLAMHPEMMDKLTQIQKVGPGEQLQAPLDLMGAGSGPAPAQGMQGMQPQPSQMPQPQQPQGQAAGGYVGPQNTNGLMDQPSLQNLVDRRLKGDVEVNTELGGGLSGMGNINKANFQKLLVQSMQSQSITPADLAARDAKYPAYKDATKTNAQTASRMQLAQSEAFGMIPLLTKAAAAVNPSNYPIFNKAKLEVLAQTGDPRSAQLASYANALINTYARGISTRPQGATDSDKEHLREVVNPYWSKGQWEAGARAIMNELGIAHGAIAKNQNRIDVQFGFGKDADPNDVASAKGAIGRGADKEDVIRRFEEGGFNAPKF